MDHLSACYFCGAAMDDPLRDYRVVPVELRESDDVTTATLCPSCHDKLERLLAPVVESAGGAGATLDARGSGRRSRPDDTSPGAVDPDERATDEADTGEDTDETREPNDDEDGGETAVVDEGLGDAEDELVDVEDAPLGENDASAPPEDDPLEAAEPGGSAGPSDSAESADSSESTDSADSPDGTDSSESTDSDDAGTASSDTATGESDEGAETTEAGSATARTSISALEYNKVMRLLQNREFPVDRVEFETVAANAYGLAEHECAQILDVAIDRGLIDEEGNELVRPD